MFLVFAIPKKPQPAHGEKDPSSLKLVVVPCLLWLSWGVLAFENLCSTWSTSFVSPQIHKSRNHWRREAIPYIQGLGSLEIGILSQFGVESLMNSPTRFFFFFFFFFKYILNLDFGLKSV